MVALRCQRADAEVADICIGRRSMRLGLGFGGRLPAKGLRGFNTRADERGADEAAGILREADAVSSRRR
ncbi:hypothetical protein AB0D30_33450 [Streptomyces sp. NPDC048409]|uniref:hypothetical protein n=1 Tax=Streptomyces sp. NPDC048409 TaxID=3154723 RepID=UPI00343F9D87